MKNYIHNKERLCRQEQQVFDFERPPRILQAALLYLKKEAEGPFGSLFDEIDPDGKCGQDNGNRQRVSFKKRAVKKVIEKAHLLPKQIRYVFAGDLLGQCIVQAVLELVN